MEIDSLESFEEATFLIKSRSSKWRFACSHCSLSETFMRENTEYLFWDSISRHQKLSESFIGELIEFDKETWVLIDWTVISEHQQMSKEFIIKHLNLLSVFYILQNDNISDDDKQEIKIMSQLI